ncbi:MAG TPA: TonB-dependent receptor, partial [Blastocatellia bacterium]|nr:TonB-dependent receptor [Blastocatellia bacterium]
MRRKVALATLALLVFANVVPVSAFAQSNTGTLVGTVIGPDGVISGANVVITDNATGKERTVTSGENGNFTVSQLDPGTYTVKVSAPGFKTYTALDLKIDIGKEYNLVATLEVGAISETVTVTAGEDLIHASSAELSNTVGPRQIQELPLNGRNPLALISLQAGVASNGATNTSINGLQPTFTNITRDGINVQDNFIRSNATDFIPDRPNVDDVGEFTIVTQNAGAELGYGSAQIQLVTPRGANEFHGGAYLYNRNSEFAANEFFNNSADPAVERPFLNRNQFGGKLGGRIIRDKLFFFGAYEGFRLRQSTNPNRTILLPQARQGIFTYLDNSGVRRSVNILSIAGISIDPLVQSRILDRTPTSGNNTDAGDQLNTTGFRFNQKQNQDREAFTIRMDHEISQNQSLNGVYSYREEFLLRPDIEGGGGFNPTPFGFQDAQTHFLALAHRWTMSDSFTNEVRGGLQFSKPAFGRTDEPTDFFFTVPLISSPESTFQTQGRDTEIWNIQDNAAWIRGVHAVRFGGQLQAFRTNPYGPPAFSNSTIPTLTIGTNPNTPQISASQFNNPALFPGGISSTQRTTANNLLALLGGIVSSAQLTFNATSQTSGFVAGLPPRNTQERHLDYENLSLYVSDQWRLRPNLTLNLGLRYELFTPLREANGLALEPVIPRGGDPVAAILDPNGIYDFVGTNAGGNNFHRADRDNFAPVISFAYSPNFEKGFLGKLFPGGGRSVLRGGFRVSYVNDEFVRAADNALRGNAGLTQTVFAVNPTTGTTQLNRRLSDGAPGFDTPEFKVPRTFAENNELAGLFGTVFAVDPNLQSPRILEYNFSIERELGFNTAVEFRYVGGRSDNLVRGIDLNQVDIRGNGFLDDFIRARNNLERFGSAACPDPSTGCEPLTVFPNLVAGGLLTNATILNQLRA